MSHEALVGRTGRVVAAVRGTDRPGEVRVVVRGLPHYYLAYCPQPLVVGQEVLVVASRGDLQVEVEPWEALPETPAP